MKFKKGDMIKNIHSGRVSEVTKVDCTLAGKVIELNNDFADRWNEKFFDCFVKVDK